MAVFEVQELLTYGKCLIVTAGTRRNLFWDATRDELYATSKYRTILSENC